MTNRIDLESLTSSRVLPAGRAQNPIAGGADGGVPPAESVISDRHDWSSLGHYVLQAAAQRMTHDFDRAHSAPRPENLS